MWDFLNILIKSLILGVLNSFYITLLFLGLYLYPCYCLSRIGNKLNDLQRWKAYIPIVSAFYLIKLSGKSYWWFILFIIPLVNIVITCIIWVNISKKLNKSPWHGLLMIIPGVNLFDLGYLAFSKQKIQTEAAILTINPELLEYVKTQLNNGFAVEDIKKNLSEAGWQEKDIDKAINEALLPSGAFQSTPSDITSGVPRKSLEDKIIPLIIIFSLIIGGFGTYRTFFKKENKRGPTQTQLTPQPTQTSVPQLSPSEVYIAYRTELDKAKKFDDLSVLAEKYMTQEGIEELEKTPPYQREILFNLFKSMASSYGTMNDIKVINQEIGSNTATLSLETIKDPNAKGTVSLTLENGLWKIDLESWKTISR